MSSTMYQFMNISFLKENLIPFYNLRPSILAMSIQQDATTNH
jgi:hypothetical protein